MSIGVGRGEWGVDIGVLQTSHVLKKFCSDPNSLYHPTILLQIHTCINCIQA